MTFIGISIFICSFLLFDAIRKLNNNVLDQTEEIKQLREELKQRKSTY